LNWNLYLLHHLLPSGHLLLLSEWRLLSLKSAAVSSLDAAGPFGVIE